MIEEVVLGSEGFFRHQCLRLFRVPAEDRTAVVVRECER